MSYYWVYFIGAALSDRVVEAVPGVPGVKNLFVNISQQVAVKIIVLIKCQRLLQQLFYETLNNQHYDFNRLSY